MNIDSNIIENKYKQEFDFISKLYLKEIFPHTKFFEDVCEESVDLDSSSDHEEIQGASFTENNKANNSNTNDLLKSLPINGFKQDRQIIW